MKPFGTWPEQLGIAVSTTYPTQVTCFICRAPFTDPEPGLSFERIVKNGSFKPRSQTTYLHMRCANNASNLPPHTSAHVDNKIDSRPVTVTDLFRIIEKISSHTLTEIVAILEKISQQLNGHSTRKGLRQIVEELAVESTATRLKIRAMQETLEQGPYTKVRYTAAYETLFAESAQALCEYKLVPPKPFLNDHALWIDTHGANWGVSRERLESQLTSYEQYLAKYVDSVAALIGKQAS